MDNGTIKEKLRQTTASILENAAFIFIDDDDTIVSCDKFSFTGVTISFTGPSSGRMNLWMVKETIDVIARNLLGMDDDEDVSPIQRYDALKEILNMIAGNLLTSLFDEKLIFNLDVPYLLDQSITPDFADENTIILCSEMIPIILSFTMIN